MPFIVHEYDQSAGAEPASPMFAFRDVRSTPIICFLSLALLGRVGVLSSEDSFAANPT